MSATIHVFRPKRTSPENLEAIFVGREHILQDMLVHLNRWEPGVSRQHYLLIGPRGIGKTNLLILLENRVNKNQDLRKKWYTISLPEDMYRVTKVSDLLVESLRILSEIVNDHNVKDVYNQIQFDDNENRVIDLSLDAFRQFHTSHKCGILLMAENINRLLERDIRHQADIRLLRKILIEEDWLMMVCTSPTFLNAVTEPEEPLFEFFYVRVLSELSFDEQQSMMHKLASLSGNIDFQNYFKKFQSRLKALYHFTGGNPRLTIMLYDLVADQNITEVKTELDLLLDKLTPFYQDRMKDIPEEQGKLLESMALLPEGCTPTELARQTRMPAKNVRALVARLEKAGYIRKEERRLKRTVYILPERFFRIWHQMNHSRAVRGRVQYLLEFFSSWYATKEERDRIWNELTEKFQEGFLEGDESRTEDIAEYMEYITAVSKGTEIFEREFDRIKNIIGLKNKYLIIKELNKLDHEHQNNVDYLIHKGHFLANYLGWHQEAYDSFKRAIDLKQDDIVANFNRAVTLDKMGNENVSRQAYLETASFLSKSKGLDAIDKVEFILIKILEEEKNSLILRIAAYILGRTAEEDIAEKIITILQKSKLSQQRQNCATALGLLRAREAAAPLIASLKDEANNVRGSAATALGRIGSIKAVAPLIECLKDEANDVRGSVANALGRIGAEHAVTALIECLKDEANNVRVSAVVALARISHEKPIPNILDVINILIDLTLDDPKKKVEFYLRQLFHASFRSRDLKTVRDSIELVKSKLDNSNEFCAPYLIALDYLESSRNPAIIERQHLEMREAVLLLVNAFDEGYKKFNYD